MYFLLALAPLLLSNSVTADAAIGALCDVADLQPKFPAGQTNLSVPAGTKARFVAIGLGTQNYTCSPSGTFTSMGALAELFDISCLGSGSSIKLNLNDSVTKLPDATAPFPDSHEVWQYEAQVRALLGPKRLRLGSHYFTSALVPIFDFTADLFPSDDLAFTADKKVASLEAPNPSVDIPWLRLDNTFRGNVTGNLAEIVFRTDTKFGQPPKTCEPGSGPISVRYIAQYWFFTNETSADGAATSSRPPKTGSLNAQLASDSSDTATLQKLLKYAPIMMGLLGATTLLSLILVAVGISTLCRSRRRLIPSRSTAAAYHPVQLPRAKHSVGETYHDEAEPYGS